MGRRINTIMQTCFFAISGILPREEAIAAIKKAVDKTYGKKSKRLADLNHQAIDMTLANLHEVPPFPKGGGGGISEAQSITRIPPSPHAKGGARRRPPRLRARRHPAHLPGPRRPPAGLPHAPGRHLPGGHGPIREAQHRPGNPGLGSRPVHPVRQVRVRLSPFGHPRPGLPGGTGGRRAAHLQARAGPSKDYPPGTHISYQVAPEDCTGCGDCVEACPIHDKSNVSRLAVNMAPVGAPARAGAGQLRLLPGPARVRPGAVKHGTIPGSALLDPLFEYSGACAGCGETPYIRLATQLFGDRMLIANATGCSSIYGGNLPTTPYTVNGAGRGPAWSNSLFEDNAEFGLGMRLAADQLMDYAKGLVKELAADIGGDLAEALVSADQREEAGYTNSAAGSPLLEKLAASAIPAPRNSPAWPNG
jgi:pyruvate-ferredoxin/flavodoxin oxidoreductase